MLNTLLADVAGAAADAAAALMCSTRQQATMIITGRTFDFLFAKTTQWLNDSVVSALGIQTRGHGFDSQVAPLFHWVATLGKLFTHIASPVSQRQETGVQKGVFGA